MISRLGLVIFIAALPLLAADSADEPPAPVAALAIVPDESGYVKGSQAGVRFVPFDSSQGRGRSIDCGLENIHALAFSPKGDALAIAGGVPGESGKIELRAWPSGVFLGKLEGHEDLALDVAWLDSGARLASASADATIRIWDVSTKRLRQTLEGHSLGVTSLAVSPDGRWLCSGSLDSTIRVWSASDGNYLRALNNQLGPVRSLAFRRSGDGLPVLASTADDAAVRFWQPSIGRLVRLARPPVPCDAIVWTPNGETVVAGGKDGRLYVVEQATARIVEERPTSRARLTSLALTTAGRIVVGDVSGGVHVGRIGD